MLLIRDLYGQPQRIIDPEIDDFRYLVRSKSGDSWLSFDELLYVNVEVAAEVADHERLSSL